MGRSVFVRVDSNFLSLSLCVADMESIGCVLLKDALPLKLELEPAGCE